MILSTLLSVMASCEIFCFAGAPTLLRIVVCQNSFIVPLDRRMDNASFFHCGKVKWLLPVNILILSSVWVIVWLLRWRVMPRLSWLSWMLLTFSLYTSSFDAFFFAACLMLTVRSRGRLMFLWHTLMRNELAFSSFRRE